MAKSLGPNQLAQGMRSGKKMLAKDLVQDGRNPGLWDSAEWIDPPHPQERPYIPDDVEGKARFKVMPENIQFTPPVLEAVLGVDDVGDPAILLSWTVADYGPDSPTETYTIYRAVDGGVAVIIEEIPVEYTEFGELITPNVFADTDIENDHTYTYYVVSTSMQDFTTTSNSVAVPVDDLPVYRITEDDILRATGDDAFRITEAA